MTEPNPEADWVRVNYWRARAEAAEAERDALAAQLDLPCGSCHPCMNWSAEALRRERDALVAAARVVADHHDLALAEGAYAMTCHQCGAEINTSPDVIAALDNLARLLPVEGNTE